MYVPSHFKEEDRTKLHQHIRDYSFGVLIVSDRDGIEANHVPFQLCVEDENSFGFLRCHLARSNTVWKRLSNARVLAIFQGPDAYVSPSWYPTKLETGRVVPTWNYLSVHVEGVSQVIEDYTWIKQHLCQLTDQNESRIENPWSIDDAPPDFTERLIKNVVGIEIKIENIIGKLKASQNQPQPNRLGVKSELENSAISKHRDMAKLIS